MRIYLYTVGRPKLIAQTLSEKTPSPSFKLVFRNIQMSVQSLERDETTSESH